MLAVEAWQNALTDPMAHVEQWLMPVLSIRMGLLAMLDSTDA